MKSRLRISAAAAVLVAAIAVAVVLGTGGDSEASDPAPRPGQPTVDITTPRNGARQQNHSVVVKAEVHNFEMAPEKFGKAPEIAQGHIRFSLNKVPDCVDPVKLRRALDSPLGKGRLQGRSFDYPHFAGPNGVLAELVGSQGSYSPATRPEIYYANLPVGFYRLVVTLAQNNGGTTPFHSVTTFQILPKPGEKVLECEPGKVSTSEVAGQL